jgi:tetratricopeptide (TPR) repeat protein
LKEWPETLDYMQRSLAAWQRLVRGNPAVDRFKIQMGDAWYEVGMAQLELNRPDDALESFSQARDIKRALLDGKPENYAYRSALGAALENVASTLHRLARDEEARTTYQQAIDQQRQAFDSHPTNVDFRRLLAHHYLGLAEVERTVNQPDAAKKAEAEAAAVNP